jgi:hypothetical protein
MCGTGKRRGVPVVMILSYKGRPSQDFYNRQDINMAHVIYVIKRSFQISQ